MKIAEKLKASKPLLLLLVIVVGIIVVALFMKYSSDSDNSIQLPPPPSVTKEKVHEVETKTKTLNGYISWISCGDGCDAYGFTDQNNKTWTISRPDRSYDVYINKHQLVSAQVKIVDETTLDIIKIE